MIHYTLVIGYSLCLLLFFLLLLNMIYYSLTQFIKRYRFVWWKRKEQSGPEYQRLKAEWGFPETRMIMLFNICFFYMGWESRRYWWVRFFGRGFVYQNSKISYLRKKIRLTSDNLIVPKTT